jgi:tetratricopeptide (TPR) repeat protein
LPGRLGDLLQRLGRNETAIVFETKRLTAPSRITPRQSNPTPNNVTAYLARGTAHLEAFAFDSAITDFTKAIELKPNNDSAYTNRGAAYYEKAEFDRAIADFTKAIDLNPKSALAYCNLGWTYEAMGDEREAIVHYRKALKLDPSLEAARDNLKLLSPRQPIHRQTKSRN